MLSIFKKSFLTIVLGLFVFFFFSNLEAKKSPKAMAWHICVTEALENFGKKIAEDSNRFQKDMCTFFKTDNLIDCKREIYKYKKLGMLEYKMDEYILKVEVEPFCGKQP